MNDEKTTMRMPFVSLIYLELAECFTARVEGCSVLLRPDLSHLHATVPPKQLPYSAPLPYSSNHRLTSRHQRKDHKSRRKDKGSEITAKDSKH